MISFVPAKSGDICGALCCKLTLCGAGFLVAVKEALENPVELLCDNNPKKAFEL